jgi:tetratricopeptide (TPR) repeat protein
MVRCVHALAQRVAGGLNAETNPRRTSARAFLTFTECWGWIMRWAACCGSPKRPFGRAWKSPQNWALHYLDGRALYELEKLSDSEKAFQRAIERNPRSVKAEQRRASHQAARLYDQILTLDPLAEVWTNMGLVLHELDRHREDPPVTQVLGLSRPVRTSILALSCN